jgi:hypothetical protein
MKIFLKKKFRMIFSLVIVIRNSRLLLGCVDKSVLGANGKTNVFYMLLRDCSEAAAALAMARLARLTSYYLSMSIVFFFEKINDLFV